MFIAGRVICGISSGMVFANTPVYMSEVSPPHTRGLLVGLHGVGIVTAYILAAVCALAFSFVEDAIQWRCIFIILTGLILLWVMGQVTGITTIGNLIPTLMGSLGFGTTMQLGLGVVWTVCAVIGCGINVLIMDKVRRVKFLGMQI